MLPDKPLSLGVNAELLSWQSRIRIMVASFAAIASLAFLATRPVMSLERPLQTFATVLLATQAYVLLAVFGATTVRRRPIVPDLLVSAIVLGDLAYLFALTIAVAPPMYYDRALIGAFLLIHVHALYFGPRQAALVLVAGVVGYAGIVQIAAGDLVPHWRKELWTLSVFVAGGLLVIGHLGRLRARLEIIAQLFARAEEGDFTESYDDDADRHPDAVTRVGRGYNRVRGQLASMVLTDPLTGCLNRRGLDQALARETARATRAGSDLALLAIDIDHFKTINDTLGHPAGDAVLRDVGALLLHAARAGDVVARSGGEEFTIVLPDTSAAGAFQLAGRLCELFREHVFGMAVGKGTSLTVSIGVAASDAALPEAGRDVAEALKAHADQALYAAKRGGRDRVRAWAPEDEEPVVLGV